MHLMKASYLTHRDLFLNMFVQMEVYLFSIVLLHKVACTLL